jgi:outer membrane protein OmpA-like peptidoglycan-associated protein
VWVFGVSFDFAAQTVDVRVNVALVSFVFGAPNFIEQIVTRPGSSRLTRQTFEDVKFERREFDFLAAERHLMATLINYQIANRITVGVFVVRIRRQISGAPEQRLHTHFQLARTESELRTANEQLEKAENAWRLNQAEAEVDAAARTAISLAVKAEETAGTRAGARKRRDEISRRDAEVREAENSAATATQQIQEMRERLRNEEHARELAERDAANSTQQLRELRNEVAGLRDELQATRAASEQAKLQLARIEGEKSAEQARLAAEQTRGADEQRALRQREAAGALRLSLARFGTVKETARGLVLILPDAVWAGARAADLTPKAAATTIDPLAALLSNNPDFKVVIEAFTDSRGEAASLQKLTQDRAETLAGRLVSAGVDGARIQASGMGTSNPLSANTTPAGRLRNRRIELTLIPVVAGDASATQDGSRN